MSIRVKSNRNWMMKPIIIFVIAWPLCVIGISITVYFEYDEELIFFLILSCVVLVIFIIAILVIKFYKNRIYEFTENEIKCFKRNRLLNTIDIANIEKINFYRYKLRYIVTIFLGELPSGGAWSLHVWMKDGTKNVLRFFSKKDAEMLKEKIFGELLTII